MKIETIFVANDKQALKSLVRNAMKYLLELIN